MNKLIKRFKCWNMWRKCSMNPPVYKFLVLIGFIKSPTFELDLRWNEWRELYEEAFMEVLKNG